MKTLCLVLTVWLVQEKPPTHDQAGKIAASFIAGTKSGDWKSFDESCDLAEFTKRVIGLTKLSDSMRGLFRTLIQGDELLGPRNALREFLALSAHVKLLKVRDVSGVPRPLFRTIQQGGLTGYCELIIATGADGKPRVIDGFVYSTGLTLSEFMRLMFMPPEESLKVLNELRAPTPADLMYSKESLTKLANLSGEGKHAEAMEHFRKNKAEFRKDKLAFSLALRISALVSAEAHIATFEEFEKEFPGDPAVRFNRSDALKMAGKSDQALEAVDAIDREVGGDPYLDVIRAQILAEAGRMEKAAQAAKRCTDAEPALAEGWYSRVNLLLAKGDWDGSAKLLTEGDRHIKLESSRVSQLSRFDEFKTTKPYEAWMASRPR